MITIPTQDPTMPSANHFQREFTRLRFDHASNPGQCFIRARISADQVLVLCTQLREYSGPSITNAVESIVTNALEELARCNALAPLVASHPRWHFWRRAPKPAELVALARERLVWVEHYTRGCAIGPDATWALVVNPSDAPQWHYAKPSALARRFRVGADFFDVADSRLTVSP